MDLLVPNIPVKSVILNPQANVPVLIEDVLQHIMTYLELKDLKSCRLVDKTWCSAVKRNMQQAGSITEESLGNLCCNIFDRSDEEYDRLFRMGCIGFKQLSLDLLQFNKNILAQRVFLDFLESFASQIKIVTMKTNLQTLKVMFQFVEFIPNLEYLKIILVDFTTLETQLILSWSTEKCQPIKNISIKVEGYYALIEDIKLFTTYSVFLFHLFQKCPNLESLHFCNSPRYKEDNNENVNMLLDILIMMYTPEFIKENVHSLKLCNLSFDRFEKELSYSDLNRFASFGLNLQKLCLSDCIPFNCEQEAFEFTSHLLSTLERQSKSMIELSIKIPTSSFRNHRFQLYEKFLQFPNFPLLEKLEIDLCFHSAKECSQLNFYPIQYDIQLPALKELNVIINFSEYGLKKNRFARRVKFLKQFFPDNNQVCKSLKRLDIRLPYPIQIRGDKAPNYGQVFLRILSSLFPNVNNHEGLNTFRMKNY